MELLDISASSLAYVGTELRVGQKPVEHSDPFLRFTRAENVLAWCNSQTLERLRRSNDWPSHSQRLQHFVLHAARYAQRCDSHAGTVQIGAYIRYRTDNVHMVVACQVHDPFTWLTADDVQVRVFVTLAKFGPDRWQNQTIPSTLGK